jgi:predicted N-acetyltransferase YhbS
MASIVRASASHRDAICELFVAEDLAQADGLQARVARSLERSPETCFVAVDSDRTVGAIVAMFNGFHVFLSHMAVASSEREKGTGRALHDALVEAAKSLGAKGIITDSWLTATGFYYNLGYRLPGAIFLIRDV